jgi:hypothetical protein
MPDSAQSLPIALACRLWLDSVSYSNALPPFSLAPFAVKFAAIIPQIAQRADEYLRGRVPTTSFEILVPKKNGAKKRWLLPSALDQIVMQAAACSLARPLSGLVDAQRVFSYRFNHDPNRLQFTDSQVSAWALFQDDTQRRLQSAGGFLLQFDLEAAFASIQRPTFFEFLAKQSGQTEAIAILRALLDGLSGAEHGLPLINDTVFFLGNAYLHVVDAIVRRYVPQFTRFVDDYRLFGSSAKPLEAAFESISRDLAPLGFKANISKVKLGSSSDYLGAISSRAAAKTETDGNYISAVVLSDVVAPEVLVELIERVIAAPDDYMNEGLGRLLLGAIRRLRLNDNIAINMNYPRSPLGVFDEAMKGKQRLSADAALLFQKYATNGEHWRAAWIAYVLARNLPATARDAVLANAAISPLVQRWAQWSKYEYVNDPVGTDLDSGYLQGTGGAR